MGVENVISFSVGDFFASSITMQSFVIKHLKHSQEN